MIVDQKYVYIALIRAETGLGKMVRKFIRYEYTHTALCLDETLTDFFTFSRRNHYNAMDAGFMNEIRSCYAFGDLKEFKTKVFKLPVSEESLNSIMAFIRECEQNDYLFNVFSMITMPVLHGFRIDKSHNCLSFIGKVIELSGCVPMHKPFWRYMLKEYDELLADFFYFEGLLCKNEKELENYMTKPKIKKRISCSCKTIFGLIKRMFKRE